MGEIEQTAPTENEASHERAARQIREKFAVLGIVAQFSAPIPQVTQSGHARSYDPPSAGWAHVNFGVSFSRKNGATPAFSSEYNIGTGLAPWKDARVRRAVKMPHTGAFTVGGWACQAAAERMVLAPHSRPYRPEIEAQAAAIACTVAKWTPDPAEVFAAICREGFEARDVSFEDWAQDFGYDPDSRQGERIFETCRDQWANVLRLVSAADAEEFATLAGEL